MRAFVAVAEDRYFGEAAARLGISQQAVSKRIARLESAAGVRLLTRARTGAELTEEGAAFLAPARTLVGVADQALSSLRGRRRALRVDVLDTRTASIDLVRAFHEEAAGVDVEIVTSNGLRSQRAALLRGTVDAAFCRASTVPDGDLVSVPAYLEPLHLLMGRGHPLAGRREVTLADLRSSTIWMPGNERGSEWAEYYRYLGADFALTIDTTGPNFGYEHFVSELAEHDRPSFIGERSRVPWHPDTVRVPVTTPVPVYPWSVLHHRENHHPALRLLLAHIEAKPPAYDPHAHWLPEPDRPHFRGREQPHTSEGERKSKAESGARVR